MAAGLNFFLDGSNSQSQRTWKEYEIWNNCHSLKPLNVEITCGYFNHIFSIINRPCVAGAVLQKPLPLIDQLITQVFGHGWLCHPTSCRGRFSEHFNLSTGFVIQ